MDHLLRRATLAGGLIALLGLTSCGEYGFPTVADAVCGVSGAECHAECRVTSMPAVGPDRQAVSYHIGPSSCPARYVDRARRAAERSCRDRGLNLAAAAPQITDQPPVPPLPAARAVTFRCHG